MYGDLSWPLARSAELYGSEPALEGGGRRLTYAELAEHIRALAFALSDLGVEPGGRIGYLGVNSLAHVECAIGVPASGRVLVDLNFRLSEAELAFIVSDSDVEVLVVDSSQIDVARGLRERCPSVRELVYDGPAPHPADSIDYWDLLSRGTQGLPSLPGQTLASISYTGGTTGPPKGVMLSHANMLANAQHNLLATGHRDSDRWLHVCPMFHVAGTANIFACTWVGARQVVVARFEASAVVDAVRAHQITHMLLVPIMLGMLMDELDQEPISAGLPSLRHIQYAASPISAALQRRMLAHFDCDIAQFYGMTEAAPTVSHLSPAQHRLGHDGHPPHPDRLRGIGVPVVGVQAEVRNAMGAICDPSEVGELWVRGPIVMLGYWKRPDATAEALVDGWYRTGDAARRDEHGYLYLVDRLKDMIITGGENVYSVEVESALCEHPAVAEAAVFAVPDQRWGEAVHAVVSLTSGQRVAADELIAHCRSLIAGYKVPRSIEVRDAPLPKSAAGKLLKNVIREPFWEGHDRRVN
jgi:long-chain acyl-CoA synthetase